MVLPIHSRCDTVEWEANRVRTLYFCMGKSITKFGNILYCIYVKLICVYNCCIPSRRINHYAALLHALILCLHMHNLPSCLEHFDIYFWYLCISWGKQSSHNSLQPVFMITSVPTFMIKSTKNLSLALWDLLLEIGDCRIRIYKMSSYATVKSWVSRVLSVIT
jgi:hypothetical protein